MFSTGRRVILPPPGTVPILHLHLDDAGQDPVYRVRLLRERDDAPGVIAPLAEGSIPVDLAVAHAPPHPDDASRPDTIAEAADALLSTDAPVPGGARRIGGLLFALLDASGIGPAWKAERDAAWAARHSGPPLVTLLHVHAPALRALPWEALYQQHRFFHTETLGPWMRVAETSASSLGPIVRPLRLLVVVGCEVDDARVRWREEVQAICDATCGRRLDFDLEILERPGLDTLKATLREFRPHVLHFVGHGVAAQASDDAALELWDDATQQRWRWTTQQIFQELQTAPPHLAVINACRSAAFASEAGTWQVAEAFVHAGVGAVVGMQGDIAGEAAAYFAQRLYERLAEGDTLPASVAFARHELSGQPFADERREWLLPTLTVAAPPTRLLPLEAPPAAALVQATTSSPTLEKLGYFVGRRPERRRVRGTLDPTRHASAGHVLVLSGTGQIGKSEFAKSCLEYFVLRGHQVVYVDLATGSRLDAIGLLRAIRGPETPTRLDVARPVLYQHFAEFHEELNALLEGNPPPATLTRTAAAGRDAEQPYHADRAHLTTLPRAYDTFRRALATVAAPLPLVLVLDHLGGPGGGMLPDEFRRVVLPHLVEPVHRGEVPGVRLVLTLREDDLAEFGLEALQRASGQALARFPRRDWRWLANEYLRLRGFDRAKAERWRDALEEDLTEDGFEPEDLRLLGELVRRRQGGGG